MEYRLVAIRAFLIGAISPTAMAATTIPIEIVEGNNFASLFIGSTQLKAHIDTGGYQTLGLSPAALERVKVQFTGTFTTRTDGTGNKFSQREFIVPQLRLGGQVFHNVRGYERLQAASGGFGGAAFDALIGRDFLKQFTVVVDYPRRRFELHDPAVGASVCGRPTAKLTQNVDGFFASTVETDHGPLQLVWDTGARGASFVQESVAAERELPLKDDAYLTKRFAVGPKDLGPLELVPIALSGFPDIDGLIGIRIFASHRICFDFRELTVSVQ
jgi:hypothetical protein